MHLSDWVKHCEMLVSHLVQRLPIRGQRRLIKEGKWMCKLTAGVGLGVMGSESGMGGRL